MKPHDSHPHFASACAETPGVDKRTSPLVRVFFCTGFISKLILLHGLRYREQSALAAGGLRTPQHFAARVAAPGSTPSG